MIDIHSHILPMIDDGAQSMDMALKLLDDAYRNGTNQIVLTPHFAIEYDFYNPKDKIIPLFQDFQEIVFEAGIPIQIYLGCEYLISSPEQFIKMKEQICRMNNTHYILIEFFFDVDEDTLLQCVDTVLNNNLIPIIAHPERYHCIQDSMYLAKDLVKKGCLLQLNKASILGMHGRSAKHACVSLLNDQLYAFVGSDAHHPNYRDSILEEAYNKIEYYYGSTYTRRIFNKNPELMLQDIDIRNVF